MDIAAFDEVNLEQICRVLGDTSTGLTGSEITRHLQSVGVEDVSSMSTKWERLYDALHAAQEDTGSGSSVVRFIENAMRPVNFWRSPESFTKKQAELNRVLEFCGCRLEDNGHVVTIKPIQTLAEAEARAANLYELLESRHAHPDVLKVCKPELVVENYYHAVLEAAKSINIKIRAMTGFTDDGSKLANRAFGGNTPLYIINAFASESQWSEQIGFLNLLQGVFSAFRNPMSHELKSEWPLDEQDALDILSLISYLHRRLDKTVRNSDNKAKP